MWEDIKDFYRKNINSPIVGVSIPGALASIIFITRRYDEWYALTSGIIATVLIPLHGYLQSITSQNQLKDIKKCEREGEYWKKELKNHKWLLNAIKEMITKKLNRLKAKGYIIGEGEYRDAVIKNLNMLLKFYKNCSDDPDNSIRITLFKKSEDNSFLQSIFYATEDEEPPYSHGDIARQKEIFNKNTSQSVAVTAWKELRPIIAENETEIKYLYPQQDTKIKSIIALPCFSGTNLESNLIGILTIASNKKEFFKRDDIEKHKDYIDEFALRIGFEYHKLQSLQST